MTEEGGTRLCEGFAMTLRNRGMKPDLLSVGGPESVIVGILAALLSTTTVPSAPVGRPRLPGGRIEGAW